MTVDKVAKDVALLVENYAQSHEGITVAMIVTAFAGLLLQSAYAMKLATEDFNDLLNNLSETYTHLLKVVNEKPR